MGNCYPLNKQRAMFVTDKQFAALKNYINVDFGYVCVYWHSLPLIPNQELHNFTTELVHSSHSVLFRDIMEIPKEILQQFPFWAVTIGAPQLEQFDLTQYNAETDQFVSIEMEEPPKADIHDSPRKFHVSCYQAPIRLCRKRKHGAQVKLSKHLNKVKRFRKYYTVDFETTD